MNIRVLLRILSILAVFLFVQCKDDLNEGVYPEPDPKLKESWLTRMNTDVVSLKSIVLAIANYDSVTSIQVDSNRYVFSFKHTDDVSFLLDNANYPAPLIGAHKIDELYYWTRIVGTGTSATVLIKDAERSNYNISKEGVTPQFGIDDGAWVIKVEDQVIPLFDSDGDRFRAIGEKSLFKEVRFDIDSNITIVTNEVPNHEYFIPRQDPLTLLLPWSGKVDTLTVAPGFSIPIDFESSGIKSLDFNVPEGWSATYQFSGDNGAGVIMLNAPTGLELNFEASGSIQIIASSKGGRRLERNVPIKTEMGLVNYASIYLSDAPAGLEITGAKLFYKEEFNSTETKVVTAIKAGDSIRVIPPEGFPVLYSASIEAVYEGESGSFDYYFEPGVETPLGSQRLSIEPPKIFSYWQGGLIVHINENVANLKGWERYKITGKVVSPHIAPKIRWFPNGNVDVKKANSETDGAANTEAIIDALYGPGKSATDMARWAIRVRDGGYDDWYLGAAHDYEIISELRRQNETFFDGMFLKYGGDAFTPNTYWTSTNVSATKAKMYDKRYYPSITTGTKVYGANGLAFRDIQ